MGEALTARMEMEQRLRLACANALRHPAAAQGQPGEGTLVGFEALVRARRRRLIPPSDFIELASELGLLDQITHIVLEDVLAAAPRLRERFGPTFRSA
jgi:EAL domain-containing protein (putative c-di-GMP-specific phosphodiesterase class I)